MRRNDARARRRSSIPPRLSYVRERDLPLLIPLLPGERFGLEDRQRLLALLRQALRRERQRGLRGDWAYDLARHAHLLAAYRYEARSMRYSARCALPVKRSAKA
jgi:hypothetical protein